MTLLRQVCHIYPETIHVTAIPCMRGTAVCAVRTTKCRAQAFAARKWTLIRRLRVRWWLQTMREKLGECLAAGAMPEFFFHHKSLLIFQKSSTFLVQFLQNRVDHTLHPNDPWHAHCTITRAKRGGQLKFGLNLVKLGTSLWD